MNYNFLDICLIFFIATYRRPRLEDVKKLQSITLSRIDLSKGLFVAIEVNETGAKKLREKATDKEQFDLDVICLTTNKHKPLKMLAGCNDVNICIYKIFNNMFSGGH